MTISDIAILAKVSTGTVDRVIHNRGGVSKKTEKIINDLIKKNNFEINTVASALAKTKDYKIATLMPTFDKDDMFWESPFLGVEKARSEIEVFGFKIINYSYSQTDFNTYLDSFNKLIQDKPNGIILVPAFNNKTKEIFKKLDKSKIPYFFINIRLNGFNNLSFIGQHSFKSGYLAAKLLHTCLGKNPQLLTIRMASHLKNETIVDRIKGFDEYFLRNQEESTSLNIIFKSTKDKELIRKKINYTLKSNPNIKGVFVPSGRVGLISNSINKNNLTDLKVIGYDTTSNNIKCLKKNKITFLISQKSFNQGYESIIYMSDFLLKNITPKKFIYSPIEIITKENLDFVNHKKEYKEFYYANAK
jgi:LacI family transcriptional regulator